MITFLTVFIILQILVIMGQVSWVSKDEYPKRRRNETVIDIFLGIVLVIWAINLIVLA